MLISVWVCSPDKYSDAYELKFTEEHNWVPLKMDLKAYFHSSTYYILTQHISGLLKLPLSLSITNEKIRKLKAIEMYVIKNIAVIYS